MIGMKNKRLKYLLLTLFVVILGLLSRKMSACTLDFVKLYLGDVLWAVMVYFGCRLCVGIGLFLLDRDQPIVSCSLD